MQPIQGWFSAKELEDFNLRVRDFPQTERRIRARAKRDGYKFRDVPSRGAKGFVREFHISSLPENVQVSILLKLSRENPSIAAKPRQKKYCRETLWAWFGKRTDALRDEATRRLNAILLVNKLIDGDIGITQARELAASEIGVDPTSIWRWQKRVKGYHRHDWWPALCPKYIGRQVTAKFSHEAWEFFKSHYLHESKPNYSTSYHVTKDAARANGWKLPSIDAVKNRLRREIPTLVRVLRRDGEKAVLMRYPPQERDKTKLKAMEWINGDGYTHKAYVRFPGGETRKAVTWFFQDIHSNYILGGRTDVTENSDMIRLATMDVTDKYGIPDHITIDNTLAASNKWFTGGCAHRFRFPVKELDPAGILAQLGIEAHFTIPGWPLGKPVERVFGIGGMGEYIDKHHLLRDAWSKNKAVDLETFIKARNDGIRRWNNIKGRRTLICDGKLSYKEAFEQSYKHRAKRMLTESQRRFLMLPAEKVRVKADGTFTLEAGKCFGKGKNRYECKGLMESQYTGKHITVYFDPQNLFADVFCCELDGSEIGVAQCIERAGFSDTEAARDHNKKRRQMAKAIKKADEAKEAISAIEIENLMPEIEEEKPEDAKVIKPVFTNVPKDLTKNDQADNDPDEFDEDEFERLFAEGVKWRFEQYHKEDVYMP